MMGKNLIIVILVCVGMMNVQAAEKKSKKMSTTDAIKVLKKNKEVLRGITAGFNYNNLNAESDISMKAKFMGETLKEKDSETDVVNKELGLSVNYANVKKQSLGYIAGGSLQKLNITQNNKGIYTDNIILEGNVAYGIDSNLYIFAGPNITKVINAEIDEDNNQFDENDYTPQLGFQAGLGYVIPKKNISLVLTYVNYNHFLKDSYEIKNDLGDAGLGLDDSDFDVDVEVKTKYSGFVLGGNVTF